MGNQFLETNNQSKQLENLLSRFHIIQHDAAKNVILMEEITTQQEYTLRQITTNDQIQKKHIEKLIEKKLAAKSPYLSRLQSYLIQKQKNYCSNQFKTYLLFEAQAKNLKFQILERRLRKLTFDQQQIINIIQSGVLALNFLKDINHPHQAICSANIFFNKEGKALVSDPWLNQQNIPFASINHIYLSPEKLQQINNLRLQKVDWYTSDLFSLGVVILEMINLEFMDELYLRNNKQLNRILLRQKIYEVKSNIVRRYLEILLLTDQIRRTQIVNQISINRIKSLNSKNRNQSREKEIINIIHHNSEIKVRADNPITKDLPTSLSKRQQYNQKKTREKSANNSNQNQQQNLHVMIDTRNNNQNFIANNNHTINNFIHINNNAQQNINSKLHSASTSHLKNIEAIKNNPIMMNFQYPQNPQKKVIDKSIPVTINNKQIKIKFVNHNHQNNFNSQQNNSKANTITNTTTNNNIQYNPFAKISNNLHKKYYTVTNIQQNKLIKAVESNNHPQIINASVTNSNMIVNNSINNPHYFQNRSTINSVSTYPISSISSNVSYGSNLVDSQQQLIKININENEKSQEQRQQKKSQTIKPEAILQTDHSYVNTSFPKLLQYSNINDHDLSDQKYLLSYQMQAVEPKTIESYQENHSQQQQKMTVITPARRNKNINKYNSTIQQVSQRSCSPSSVINQPQYILQQYEIGSKYQGLKKNGMRNGKGTFYYQDGGYYEGQWKDNKMHGYGKLFYSQLHLAYQGDWYMDQFHGHGKVYNDNPIKIETPFDYRNFEQLEQYWQYYQGNLIKDTKEGLGIIKLSNGQIFEGEFREDKIEGKGKYTTIKGEVINGIWKNSKLQKLISS